MWHQKDPTEAWTMTYDFPERLPFLGTALRIIYWSDKWEKPGEGYHYEHDFDSRPPAYGDFRKSKSSSPTTHDTSKLLNVDRVDEQMAFPILAEVVELSLDVPGEGIRTLQFKKPPLMLCSKDKKALIILHDKPIIVRGGRMRVTDRGIVN
jgi:hypothetical protein